MEIEDGGAPSRRKQKARSEKKGRWEYGGKTDGGLVVEPGIWRKWLEVTD